MTARLCLLPQRRRFYLTQNSKAGLMQFKRIVVTGMGALTPLGNSVTEYWNNLRNGVSGCDFITLFDASKFKTRFACEIKNFNAVDYLDRKEARKVDRFTQTAIAASDQAVQDA